MTDNEFEKVLDDTFSKVENILRVKSKEYARGDRLHNFKVAAALSRQSPEMALRGMLAKHIVSVWDLINDTNFDNYADQKTWDEKIIDTINYMILLRALIIERTKE